MMDKHQLALMIRCMGMLADNVYMISTGRECQYDEQAFNAVAEKLENE